jgi:hypothetical protein
MSSYETVQISGLGSDPAPQDYVVKASQRIELRAIVATFDGSSAGQTFQPCIQIITDSGHVLAACPAAVSQDGDVVEVTFAPFLRAASSGGGGGGIQFDTDNQGGALQIETQDSGFSVRGLAIHDNSTNGIEIHEVGVGLLSIETSGNGGLDLHSDGDGLLSVQQTGLGGLQIENDGAGVLAIRDTAGEIQIDGFHGPTRIGTSGGNKLLTFYVKDGDIHWLQGGDLGTQIMALKWNGAAYELHLQTGTTIHFDL